jgi:hypothetical protein
MSAIIRAKVIVGLIGGVLAGLAAAVLVLDLRKPMEAIAQRSLT